MDSSDTVARSSTTPGKIPPPPVKRRQRQDDQSSGGKLGLPILDSMSRDQVSRYALTSSIDQGGFEDVKFFAFSQRTAKGRVYAPRGLFGNSTCIRKTAPHFDGVLTMQGWAESVVADMSSGFPADRWDPMIDNYDYADDSDIDDLEEPMGSAYAPLDVNGASAGNRTEAEGNAGEAGSGTIPVDETHDWIPKRTGRVIFLKDIAYRTWRAFVFYSYFGTISFAPLRSDRKIAHETDNVGPFSSPQCSPKSMYRLADKYDVKELKEQSAKDIVSKLTPSNIFVELFSPFTSLHPEIQELEVNFLLENLEKTGVMKELPVWIGYLAEGRLPPEATRAVTSLISKLAAAEVKPVKCPSCLRTPVFYCKSCSKQWK